MLFETLPVDLHFLPDTVRVEDVVRRTRRAADVFLTSATADWGRAKLRSWLIVEYGMATEWTREDEVAPWLAPFAGLDDLAIHEMVEDARRRVTRLMMDESAGWVGPAFAREMVARGLVTCVTDCNGRESYAPAARVELSFLQRVASLFIADFLSHPQDYACIAACPSCGEMFVGGRPRHARGCVRVSGVRAPAESGVRLREAGRPDSVRTRTAARSNVR